MNSRSTGSRQPKFLRNTIDVSRDGSLDEPAEKATYRALAFRGNTATVVLSTREREYAEPDLPWRGLLLSSQGRAIPVGDGFARLWDAIEASALLFPDIVREGLHGEADVWKRCDAGGIRERSAVEAQWNSYIGPTIRTWTPDLNDEEPAIHVVAKHEPGREGDLFAVDMRRGLRVARRPRESRFTTVEGAIRDGVDRFGMLDVAVHVRCGRR